MIDEAIQQALIDSYKRQIAIIDFQIQSSKKLGLVGKLAKSALEAIAYNNQRLEQARRDIQEKIREEKEKLEALAEFQAGTSGLFQESLNQLKIGMQGIEILGFMTINSVTGEYMLPDGFDSSWFTSTKSVSVTEVRKQVALAKGMDGLQLPKESQKYYQEIMRKVLKGVPIEQWELAIQELNQLLLFDADGNILQVTSVNFGAGNGVIVLKNGQHDTKLTIQANNELTAQQLEAFKEGFPQLAMGVMTTLSGMGIVGLDLIGTYFSGGTLAMTGLTQVAAVTGTTMTAGGAAVVTDAISKMGLQNATVNYSFTQNYGQYNKALPEKVVNDLANFNSKNFKIGSHNFKLDKSGLKHILERHHPNYWNGSIKTTQSFLDKGLSIEDIEGIIQSVMNQNRDFILQKGTKGMFQISGKVNGIDYTLGFTDGRIGQLFEIIK